MRRHTPASVAVGAFAAVLQLTANAAVPVPAPPPDPCTPENLARLDALLENLYPKSGAITSGVASNDSEHSMSATRKSMTEVTAEIADGTVLMDLKKDYSSLPTARIGDTLFVDTRPLAGDQLRLLRALCTVAEKTTNPRPSTCFDSQGSTGNTVGKNDNLKWREAIGAPSSDSTPQSLLSVAVIDGPIIANHERLPPIEQYRVHGNVGIDGTCKGGSCCVAIPADGTPKTYAHPARTVGTIAGLPTNGKEPVGLSRPARIVAIDPKSEDCETIWTLATAIQCAIDQKVDVIHYAREPVGGDAAHELFEPILDRAVNQGALLVFPAGNQATDLDLSPGWPNSYKNALTVTAFDENGGAANQTGFGVGTVDLGFPLGRVYSSCNSAVDCFDSESGMTSSASAIVTGSILLMSGYDNYRKCTAQELAARLLEHKRAPKNKGWWTAVGAQLNLSFLSDVKLDDDGNPEVGCVSDP